MEAFISALNKIIWSPALIYLCLGAGLFYSILTRFAQVRHLKEMWRLLFSGSSSREGISSFQALAVSLSGRVGMGNIAGVAAAIGFGGPGAVFWMWIVAFLGASTAYAESTLAQIYKEKGPISGQYRGGPAYYFEKCLNQKWYAIIFAIASIIACGVFLPGVQANGVVSAATQVLGPGEMVKTSFGLIGTNRLIALAIILIVLAFIIFGGIRRIANFTQVVVPFMALGYIVLAFIIVFAHITEIPSIVTMIVSDAFTAQAGFGAAIGWGVKRGIYSNEAGQGTGPHAAAAAEVEHPAQQGLVQAFSVYVDTLMVCSATAFMILITQQYNIENSKDNSPEIFAFSTENAPSWINIDADSGNVTLNKTTYKYADVVAQTNQPMTYKILSGKKEVVATFSLSEKAVPKTKQKDVGKEVAPTLTFNTAVEHPGKPVDVILQEKSKMDFSKALFTSKVYLVNFVPSDTNINSPAFTQLAMESVFSGFGSTFIAVSVFFFAFTTILAYYYIAEVNVIYLSRFFQNAHMLTFVIKVLVMTMVAYGGLNSSGYIWSMGDVGVGLMAWLNIIGILIIFFMSKPALLALKDYERQQKEGVKSYKFDPKALGIKNAHFWEKRYDEK